MRHKYLRDEEYIAMLVMQRREADIDSAAEAVCKAQGNVYPWDGLGLSSQRYYRRIAIAALDAPKHG